MIVNKSDIKSSRPEATTATDEFRTRPVFLPATDIIETKDSFVIMADMPGADEQQIEIKLENDLLTLKGHVPIEELPGYELRHQGYIAGDYERSFTLSNNVSRENMAARMNNGVLRITLQKQRELQPRQIKSKLAPEV